MRILLSKPDHAKHIGKRLSRELDVPLTRGYVIAAKLLGYATWDEFLSECNWSPIYSSSLAAWPDSRCMPHAVVVRRSFQAEALAREAGLALDVARQLVERIRPSDGFIRPDVDVIGRAGPPRHHDPKLNAADHARMSAELHGVWQFAGRKHRLSDALKRLAYALENLQIDEWPMEQFGTTIDDSSYGGGSPTYLGMLRRAPKWLSEADYHAGLGVVRRIASEVAGASILDLEVVLARVAEACRSVEAMLVKWRQDSQPHDDKPLVFDGAPLIEDEAIGMLKLHLGIDEREAYALEDPVYQEVRTRKLLARIEAMPAQHRQSPPMKFAVRRLKGGLSWLDKHHAREARQRQPVMRDWDLWAVDATGPIASLARVAAENSLDAIQAGPSYLHGRVVAVPAGASLRLGGRMRPGSDSAQPEVWS